MVLFGHIGRRHSGSFAAVDAEGSTAPGKAARLVDINLIFRIAGVGILISILNMVLKQAGKDEQAQMLTLVGVVVVLIMVIQLLSRLFNDVRSVFGF